MPAIIHTYSGPPEPTITAFNPFTGLMQDDCTEIKDELGEVIAVAMPIGEPIRISVDGLTQTALYDL